VAAAPYARKEKKSDAAQNKALLPEHPFGGYGKPFRKCVVKNPINFEHYVRI
jgi:hypothetical protein